MERSWCDGGEPALEPRVSARSQTACNRSIRKRKSAAGILALGLLTTPRCWEWDLPALVYDPLRPMSGLKGARKISITATGFGREHLPDGCTWRHVT